MDKVRIKPENAAAFREWIDGRGGVAIWRSVDLSDIGARCYTPALTDDGQPTGKPGWKWDSKPSRVVESAVDVEIVEPVEVRRFRVAVRLGAQGFKVKLTDASSTKLRAAVQRAGDDAWYEFDYGTQEAVIYRPAKTTRLDQWGG